MPDSPIPHLEVRPHRVSHRLGGAAPRTLLLFALLTCSLAGLPACVLAVGNSANGAAGLPKSTVPLLRQKVDSAQRVVTLRRARLDSIRLLHESGRAPAEDVAEAEIAVEDARIQLLQFEAELQAVQERDDDDDLDFD